MNAFNPVADTRETMRSPIGMVAVRLGLVDQELKDAILMAQAAERAIRLADDTKYEMPYVGAEDPVFKYVGSPKNAPGVRHAQTLWKEMQMAHNARDPEHKAEAIKKEASGVYSEVSSIMAKKGFPDAAEKFQVVACTIAEQAPPVWMSAEAIEEFRKSMQDAVGFIAVKLGFIKPAVKSALLMGQAAERATMLAEDILSGKLEMPEVSHDAAVFKFVGKDKDEKLNYAQALWMGAQMVHNERKAFEPVDLKEYARGFKEAASEVYKQAAKVLAEEGHVDAAAKLESVAESLTVRPKVAEKYEPNGALRYLEIKEFVDSRSGWPTAKSFEGTPYGDKLCRLCGLTDRGEARAAVQTNRYKFGSWRPSPKL